MREHHAPALENLFLHGHRRLFEDFQSYSCPSNISRNDTEDILCMEREEFLKNFKNPCWFKVINTTMGLKRVLRCFPFFHIFGVCKSGTTDLFFRLTQHPQILNNTGILNKETQFWSWKRFGQDSLGHRKLTLEEFSSFFRASEIGKTKIDLQGRMHYSDLITGHADPMDFWDHNHWREIPQNDPNSSEPKFLTPHFVRHVQPNIKLILLLREPAERLYSHYLHGYYGHTPEDFHSSVLKGIELFNTCLTNCSLKTCLYKSDLSKDMKLPLSASLYYIHLLEWLDVFPREQFLVLRTEDYHKDMKYSLFRLFSFLGVGDVYSDVMERTIKLPHKYVTKIKLEQGPMLIETWNILTEFFKEPNRKLAAILNDERYLWKDATFKFRAKQLPKTKQKRHQHLQH
ncbi:carbohydrate sulfotransferase 15-like [Saccostrea echinata]|uniref:carbohydrate sulfotransferase 15-like n=1 Tax=Saccostrea echinata TaxID=191078 RepID=UPI002A822B45|nr:carbohydrate sulfotransferase 15-like [Saccostrea echinata]